MPEEMASFFENRLPGYDEHMTTAIEGATEFYKFTAAQLPSAEHCAIRVSVMENLGRFSS